MSKKTILSLVFLAGAALGANAQENKVTTTTPTVTVAQNPNAPVMKFKVLEHNYGKIEQGKTVTFDFEFKNAGKEPLVISNAQGSCGCTVPQWPKDPISPGKTGKITVTFNSTGKMGMQDKTVTLTSNNKDGQVVLHMKGEVIAATAPAGNTTVAPK